MECKTINISYIYNRYGQRFCVALLFVIPVLLSARAFEHYFVHLRVLLQCVNDKYGSVWTSGDFVLYLKISAL